MSAEIVEQLDNAAVAHALWKARIFDAAQGGQGDFDRAKARDCHACEFGKWLDGSKSQLAVHPEYSEVYAYHQAFHHEVGVALDRLSQGNKGAALDALQGDGALRRESSELSLALLRWRDRLNGQS
ncbi:MAG: CZB domain-containing protein [Fibrobacteria bacterium]|nr:CZB domain-containing protein [Fibrobacteria bacterium]